MLRTLRVSLFNNHRPNMQKSHFFSSNPNQSHKNKQIIQSTEIKFILSHAKPGSLVILDIDDTIGRVSQTIGLDAWFRFRIQQYANDGHAESQALAQTIEIYNRVQLASRQMVTVDINNHIASLIQGLKDKGIKVVALTARNHVLVEKTLSLLIELGVYFSDDVLAHGCLLINDKPVEIKNGVIFANGNNKGHCLEQVLERGHFLKDLLSYTGISFVDDSDKNCVAVAESLSRLNIIDWLVWHYNYAEIHLAFQERDQSRAAVQEAHLLEHEILLTDEEAEHHLTSSPK